MDIAAPTVVALETSSAWILILAVSLLTFPIVLLLRRLIDRPGGVASGILLSLPLVLPVAVGIAFHGAALPEVAVLRPIGESLVSGAGKGLFDLLIFTDETGGVVVPYALWGSPGPYLFLIGVSVSSVMVLRRLVGAASIHRLIARCTPIEESEYAYVDRTVERIARAAGLRRPPKVLLMPPGYPGACVVAGRHYRLLVSRETIDSLTRPELEGLLAHEIAHVASRDVPLMIVGGFLRDVVAWNPIGHLAFRKLTSDREFEADRRAASLTGEPLAVASSLLKVYEMSRRRRPLASPAIPFVRRKAKVTLRVRRLLEIADGGGVALRRSGYGPHLVAAALVAALAMQVGASIGGESESAFAIVLGGPEIADVDVWKARTKTRPEPAKRHRTQASGEGRSRPLEAHKGSLSLKDPQLTENLAVSVKDVPRWVDRMTRMAGRAGVSEAAVRAELQQSWHAVPVFSGPAGGGLSVYRMEHDLHDEVFGRALP